MRNALHAESTTPKILGFLVQSLVCSILYRQIKRKQLFRNIVIVHVVAGCKYYISDISNQVYTVSTILLAYTAYNCIKNIFYRGPVYRGATNTFRQRALPNSLHLTFLLIAIQLFIHVYLSWSVSSVSFWSARVMRTKNKLNQIISV